MCNGPVSSSDAQSKCAADAHHVRRGFRSLTALSIDYDVSQATGERIPSADMQQKANTGRGFRSLDALTQEYSQRKTVSQPAGAPTSAPTLHPRHVEQNGLPWEQTDNQPRAGILKKFFHGKGFGFIQDTADSMDVFLHISDLIENRSESLVVGMPLQFVRESDPKNGRARARNVVIGSGGLPKESEVSKLESSPSQATPPPDPVDTMRVYGRCALLATFAALQVAGLDVPPGVRIPRTLSIPWTEEDAAPEGKRPHHQSSDFAEDQNPELDDEALLVVMEARLSAESGADANNAETFGEGSVGWTYEEAVDANAKLAGAPQEAWFKQANPVNAKSCEEFCQWSSTDANSCSDEVSSNSGSSVGVVR